MTPRTERRILDSVIHVSVILFMFSHADWIVAIVVTVYGMWNFYDGITRLDLKDD